MSDDKINTRNVVSGGGTINQVGNQIGGTGNRMHGNTFQIAHTLGVSSAPQRADLLAALRQLRAELDKAADLPPDEADDLRNNLDAAIKAIDREQPNKARTVEKLTAMQKLIEGLQGSVGSALALGKLIGEVALAARGLSF